MPKYTFECTKCYKTFQDYVDVSEKEIKCEDCGATSKRQLPKLGGLDVYEVINSETSTKQKQDHKELMKDRNEEYFWKVEVPRLATDPTYTLETKLDNGWVWIDDNGKIQIHTKPLHRR